MVKSTTPAGPGVYSATYSGIPVYEFQFGVDLKEHVMRRRENDWVNATHILKAANFDKPARTRILERDVQKDDHDKIQGGYGKYQGTWIPLEAGRSLADRHGVLDRLRPIFDFTPGDQSPPPAPRHASKPKAPKPRPPPPKFTQPPPPVEDLDNGDTIMGEDDTPDDLTVASASYMVEDDRFDVSSFSTGSRKRKKDDQMQEMVKQAHCMWGDALLDYFVLSKHDEPERKPEPPTNFQPDWPIDNESHTGLHWACAMGDMDVVKQLRRFNANIAARNHRGETPFMRSVNFTNCYEKQTFPAVMKELFETVRAQDNQGCTVIHHAAVMKNGRLYNPPCSRYYLDLILNRLQETHDPSEVQKLLDQQDHEGNTALHLAAKKNMRKCIRALLGRNASAQILNNDGVRAEDLIMELNASKKERGPQRSSSPFAPDSQPHAAFRDALADRVPRKSASTFSSTAATTVQTRITPLILDKFQELAKTYDEEWLEKDVADMEAQRILINTQFELDAIEQQIVELEAQIETDEIAARTMNEANVAKHQVTELIAHQNRTHIQREVDQELGKVNGDGVQEDSYDERLAFARQLQQLVLEQRQAETEYVDALSTVGTGDKIEKYRRLLKRCLDAQEGETLDSHLESLIEMMEEQKEVHDLDGGPPEVDMDFQV